jgi:hypothetical protein
MDSSLCHVLGPGSKYHLHLHPHDADAAVGEIAVQEAPSRRTVHTLDRLVHNAHRIEMRGDSMRKNRGKPNTK